MLSNQDIAAAGNEQREVVRIPVTYDGADLEAAAATLGVSSEAVVELHSAAAYTVAFMGFSPGFPYLIADQGARERLRFA